MLTHTYLIYSLVFLSLWLIIWFFKKDLRNKMLIISILLSPIGSISEIWYFNDYWKPVTLFSGSVNIEDFIFTFSLCGISFSLYKILFNLKLTENVNFRKNSWYSIYFFIFIIINLMVFSSLLKYNSVIVSSVSFTIISIFIWFKRRDLIFPSITSGFLTLSIFFFIYQALILFNSNFIDDWCLDCNPSGVTLYNINIEELIWDFTWGLVGGVVYEFITGKSFIYKNKRTYKESVLKDYIEFDNYMNNYSATTHSIFLHSTRHILTIKMARKISFLISKKVGKPLSDYYGILVICMTPFIVDIPFYIFGLHTSGIALVWVIYYFFLSFYLFVFSKNSWNNLVISWVKLDKIIIDKSEKRILLSWIENKLNLKRQFLLSSIAGIAAILILYILAPHFSKYVSFGAASYFQVFLNSFFGMVAVYWLWNIPLFIRELKKLSKIELLWYYPVDTDAIKSITDLLAKSSLYALIGMVLTIYPPFYYIDKLASPDIVIISGVLFILSGITVIFISAFPQYWITQIVNNSKNKILKELSKDFPDKFNLSKPIESLLSQKMLLYYEIKNSKNSLLEHKTIVNYILSITLAFFPYILSLFKKLSGYFT